MTFEPHKIVLALAEIMHRSMTIALERIAKKSTEGLHPEVIVPLSLSRFIYRQLTIVALSKGIAPHELKESFIALLRDSMDKDPENIIAEYQVRHPNNTNEGNTNEGT